MAMATMATSVNTEDAWGQPSTQALNPSRLPNSRPEAVPDDWDADADDDDDEEPEAKQLWESANTRTPMPSIQPSTTSTHLPPAAALEAPLRILKRPSAASSKSPSPLDGAQTQKSFKEREAQYQAARERIFGEAAGAGKDKPAAGARPRLGSVDAGAIPKSSIVRDPIGPTSPSEDGEARRGFRSRRKKGSRAGVDQLDATNEGDPLAQR